MKFLSCQNLQNGLRFEYDSIKYCCFVGPKAREPFFIKRDYFGEKLNWSEILEQINKVREDARNGIIDPHCTDCFALKNQEWDDNPKFKWIQIAHWSECNCRCVYCYREQNTFMKPKKRYKIMPIIKELDKMGMLDYTGELAYSGGEPSSLSEFDDITRFFLKKGEKLIMVHSNGIKPVKSVIEGLHTDTLSVTISVDCGDREKFKQIKQVDAYNKVLDTFKKYIKAQGNNKKMVRSKYILTPGLNDTKEDVDKWINESEKLGIQQLIIDCEADYFRRHNNVVPQYLDELFEYMEKKIIERGFDIQYYGNANQYRQAKGVDPNEYGVHQE